MFYSKIHEQTILEISQGDYLSATAVSFLIERQARELSRHTLRFYREFLRPFIEYSNANSLGFIQEITPDFLRRYFLAFGEKHNPGGVHGAYRTLRAFFQWLMKEEVMAPDWKNPMLKVKAPKVVLDPLEPISIEDVRALINTCQRGVDIFVLQRLMGDADLQVLRCYLAQNNEDNQLAHMRGSPVDNNL
jgi:site-specific recombinase XerD